MVPLLVAEPHRDLVPDEFEIRGMAEFPGKETAEPAQKIKRGREADGGVAKSQKKERAVGIFRIPFEQLPLEQVPALVEPLPRLEPIPGAPSRQA